MSPVRAEFHPREGVELLSQHAHLELGHLEGVTGSRVMEWFALTQSRSNHLDKIRIRGGAAGNVRKPVEIEQ